MSTHPINRTGLALLAVAALTCPVITAAPITTSFLRIVGYGNDQNPWNSYSEITIDGEDISMGEVAVSASSDDGNQPANTVDGDLGTSYIP